MGKVPLKIGSPSSHRAFSRGGIDVVVDSVCWQIRSVALPGTLLSACGALTGNESAARPSWAHDLLTGERPTKRWPRRAAPPWEFGANCVRRPCQWKLACLRIGASSEGQSSSVRLR
jgi:hypothetical protein